MLHKKSGCKEYLLSLGIGIFLCFLGYLPMFSMFAQIGGLRFFGQWMNVVTTGSFVGRGWQISLGLLVLYTGFYVDAWREQHKNAGQEEKAEF